MKTKGWEHVPDDHKCLSCGLTKLDGVNFLVITNNYGITYPIYQCNICKRKGLKYDRPKRVVRRPNSTTKEEVKENIRKYFEEQYSR